MSIQTGVAIIVSRTFNLRKIHQITRCNRIIVEFTMHCKSKCPIKTFQILQYLKWLISKLSISELWLYNWTFIFRSFWRSINMLRSILLHRVIIPFQKDRRIRNFRTLPPRKTQLLEERVLNYSWICYIA